MVEIAGGTYPSQLVRVDVRKLRAVKKVRFQPAAGATVVVDGDLTMHGSYAEFLGSKRPDGSYTLRMRRLRSEIVNLSNASTHVTFAGIKAATFFITGSRFVTIRDSDFGPNVACWPRGKTGWGIEVEITTAGWCPIGSGFEETGNTDGFEPRIGPDGSIRNSWPHHILLDRVTMHDQNSLDPQNLHNGGLFLVSGYKLVIKRSHFFGNIVYDIFANDFTTPECCGMKFGAFRDVVIRENRFEAPVNAALQAGGNGWTNDLKNNLPEMQITYREGETLRNWEIARNSFENGFYFAGAMAPRFDNVTITRNLGGGGACFAGAPGLTWSGNAMTNDSACDSVEIPYGYQLRKGRLTATTEKAVVTKIFRAAGTGQSPARIARGLPPRVHGAWTSDVVRSILANRLYLGGVLGPPGAHPRLVKRSTWLQAQRALRR